MRQLFERATLDDADDATNDPFAGPAAHAAVAVGVEPGAQKSMANPDSPFPVIHALYWWPDFLRETNPRDFPFSGDACVWPGEH